MLCDECHKHEASIYVTEITSQGQIEHHLISHQGYTVLLVDLEGYVFE